jgi:hypothetical protein
MGVSVSSARALRYSMERRSLGRRRARLLVFRPLVLPAALEVVCSCWPHLPFCDCSPLDS